MRDVIQAHLDGLAHGEAVRNVPRHGHVRRVRRADDRRDSRRVQQRIELHLLEARARVARDRVAAFPRIRGGDRTEGRRARAVDESGEQQARAEGTIAPRVTQGGGNVEFAAHVARRGHAAGQVDRTPLGLADVGVHVPETRQDRLADDVDRRHVVRHGHRRGRPGGVDPPVADDDHGPLDWRPTGRVDEPRADERERAQGPRGDRARLRRRLGKSLANGVSVQQGHDVLRDAFFERFEGQDAGAGDGEDHVEILGAEPDPLASPHDAVDSELPQHREAAVGHHGCRGFADTDLIPRRLQCDRVRLAVREPVLDQQTLRRQRRHAIQRERRRRA